MAPFKGEKIKNKHTPTLILCVCIGLPVVFPISGFGKKRCRITKGTGTNTSNLLCLDYTQNQITIKYSLYFLMYGKEASYPSQIPVKWEV